MGHICCLERSDLQSWERLFPDAGEASQVQRAVRNVQEIIDDAVREVTKHSIARKSQLMEHKSTMGERQRTFVVRYVLSAVETARGGCRGFSGWYIYSQ